MNDLVLKNAQYVFLKEMTGMTLTLGQVVQLKSGGPFMTVSDISASSTRVTCQWFLKSEIDIELREDVFESEMLQAVSQALVLDALDKWF